MSRKRKSHHKPHLSMQKSNKPRGSIVNRATGLRNDEIAITIDPNNPSQAKGYILPDGRTLKPIDRGVPQGIPSIIHPDLIVTSSRREGFRQTLASRLGEMLIIAEDLFGKRDHNYTFLGVEFTEDAPHIHPEMNKSLIMRLPINSMFEPMITYAYMAHECIHLLSPCPHRPVTILEEGIAEVFAYIYMRDTMKIEIPSRKSGSAYHEAGELVAMLMSIDPYGIKRIREVEPTISLIPKALIWKHYSMLDEGVAARLARTFVKDGCTDPDILAWYERERP